MIKHILLISAAATGLFAQDYKVEAVASAAPGLPAAYASMIEAQGYRVVGPKGPWCEIWFPEEYPGGQ